MRIDIYSNAIVACVEKHNCLQFFGIPIHFHLNYRTLVITHRHTHMYRPMFSRTLFGERCINDWKNTILRALFVVYFILNARTASIFSHCIKLYIKCFVAEWRASVRWVRVLNTRLVIDANSVTTFRNTFETLNGAFISCIVSNAQNRLIEPRTYKTVIQTSACQKA